MAYQVPKSDHPWRQYNNRDAREAKEEIKKKEKHMKSLKVFMTEITENWDSIEVVTTAFSREGRFYLSELPQSKQASWLAGMLKRNFS